MPLLFEGGRRELTLDLLNLIQGRSGGVNSNTVSMSCKIFQKVWCNSYGLSCYYIVLFKVRLRISMIHDGYQSVFNKNVITSPVHNPS